MKMGGLDLVHTHKLLIKELRWVLTSGGVYVILQCIQIGGFVELDPLSEYVRRLTARIEILEKAINRTLAVVQKTDTGYHLSSDAIQFLKDSMGPNWRTVKLEDGTQARVLPFDEAITELKQRINEKEESDG